MAISASCDKPAPPEALIRIRLSGRRVLRLIQRPRPRLSRLLLLLLSLCLPVPVRALDGAALPTQGQIRVGSGTISQTGAGMTIQQSGNRLGVDWQSFNIGAQAHVQFNQPGRDAIALNRVVGNSGSEIYGKLSANGQVFLSNPNGVLFAPGAKVDVGGLVATTLDMAQADFAAGKYRFQGGGSGGVTNNGEIKAAEGGYVALFAPQVSNAGQIAVPSGRVVLAAGRAVTVEITSGGLISAVVTQGADDAKVDNAGSLQADGGVIRLDAKSAVGVASGLVNNRGIIRANTLVEKNGEIWLSGDSVGNTGDIRAEGAASRVGGAIHLEGRAVALGGNVSADGAQGGQIQVSAGERLTLAEQVSAKGTTGDGGHIEYLSGGGILENSGSHSDASGARDGGVIEVHAASGVASSGHYTARGETGSGGRIDVSGDSVHLLAASLDAGGASQGGLIRVGGGFQGGKHEPDPADPRSAAFVLPGNRPPTLTNARTTFINDGTTLDVGSGGGRGGVAIVWSDEETTFMGGIEAAGPAGGGAVEISSGELLRRADLGAVHPGAGGQLLLDPKNILIGHPDELKEWRYAGLLESIYAWKAGVPVLGNSDFMGSALALSDDARLLAVGAPGDDGAGNSRNDSGAVHLFQFADGDFGGGSLVGTLGYGYAGGRNVNLALAVGDRFGGAVALNGAGNLLAVGAPYGDGKLNNISDVGEVYLFSFGDTAFSGGIHEGTLGYGYSGGKNLGVNNIHANDHFGAAVALNGDGLILAVGAPGDDVGASANSGSVHLFGFADSVFGGAAESLTVLKRDTLIPYGAELDGEDNFGQSVALNGSGHRLAVGASGDDGFTNGLANAGAVYLFDYDNPALLIATLGHGYTGAQDIALDLAAGDGFGNTSALSNDGSLLVVGAPNDDGHLDGRSNSGAAYLFAFAGPDYTAGSLKGRIGNGYASAGDVAISVNNDSHLGYAVALNGAGDRLAVGAPWDDGAGTYLWDAGAVHLFGFADSDFGQGRVLGSIGSGYRDERGSHIELGSAQYWNGDQAGAAVALSGDARRLAIGAPYDDGGGQHAISNGNTGAVHLLTFSDGNFSGGQLVGSIGEGYLGGGDINVDLDSEDRFGAAVALDPDGRELAVGAPGDDGYGNVGNNTGALHLFKFTNDSFGGGSLETRIAHGTASGNDRAIALNDGDAFGGSVALDDGYGLLAVGAPYDDGFDNLTSDAGAVLLFTQRGESLIDYELKGRVGVGYTAAGDYNLALDQDDHFGAALALSGAHNLLAVGAPGDAGQGNAQPVSGAAYLFEFGDDFSSGSLRGRIGHGYPDAGDTALHLDVSDTFGSAVALNGDGTHLAVGAPGDDGSLGFNPWLNEDNYGAVHLFTFSDSHFGGGDHVGTLGRGYAGEKDVSLNLDGWDGFGGAVALDASGNRLAVGAPGDDGYSNQDYESGAVHLFSFAGGGFSGGSLTAHLGQGYSQGARDIPLSLTGYDYSNGDQVGQALALSDDGNLLAIGVPDHDGAGARWDISRGAVHLVTFSGGEFEDGELVGSIGYGYTGGKNVDLTVYEGERFGASVALNGDGTLLAVGVPYHNGAANDREDSGAVYFFQFTDTAFSGGQRIGTLGVGYSGAYSRDLTLDAYDYFGTSVALDSSGTLVAVGVVGDDGNNNSGSNYGMVRRYRLADDGGGTLSWEYGGSLGVGYSGGQDLNIALNENDAFGQAVALDDTGRHLAVGAPGDHGSGNAGPDQSGAVHLFTFGANFTSPLKRGTLGSGYSGSQSYDVSLDAEDRFGTGLAMSGDGLRLLVGAPGDDGDAGWISNSGAVHMFDFTDAGYAVPSMRGRIGTDYSGGANIPTWNYDQEQRLGAGLALDSAATRLALGAPGDHGLNDAAYNSGAVHLYTLDLSTPFYSGYEIRTIGRGYDGATGVTSDNWRNSGGRDGDRAGSAVALSDDARLLAIGAPYDQGPGAIGPLWSQYGAVHLFTFADGDFGGGTLAGSLGYGYTGLGNLDVPLGSYDRFGSALSLNADGTRLAVGAPGGGNPWLSGQVRLFSFSDSQFHNPALVGTIGNGASGGKDVSVDLEQNDNFGTAVALSGDGTRLAVGAPYDDGTDNLRTDSGAVYLFTFSDGDFSDGILAGRAGRGYGGPSGTSVDLGGNDLFGRSIALNNAGDRLAVGAPGDDGNGNALGNSGAVYLFEAGDFANPAQVGLLGAGYAGVGGLVFTPEAQDNFGTALAFDAAGRHLVVGASGDDGYANAWGGTGALHLFTFADGDFGGGAHAGTLGRGYIGSGDVDTSPEWVNVGEAVALSGNGTRLAAGTPYNGGGGDAVPNGGGIYLYSFSGDAFQGGRLLARIGHGGRDGTQAGLELPLEGSGSSRGDEFGAAVALSADASLLVVGAPGQDGADGQHLETGSVHLFSLGGATYLNASLVGSLGQGYSGGNDLDLALEAGDLFGSALALNASGDRLLVGAPGDDGAGNAAPDSGAAWLIRFSGANFTGPSLAGRIGRGYADLGDFAVDLGNGDAFGSALALTADARQLAVGAPWTMAQRQDAAIPAPPG